MVFFSWCSIITLVLRYLHSTSSFDGQTGTQDGVKKLSNRFVVGMSVHGHHSRAMKVLCTYHTWWDRETTSLASGHLYNNRVISEMKAIMWLNKSCFNARAGKCINHNIISVSFLSIYKSLTRSWLEGSFLTSQRPFPYHFCLLKPFKMLRLPYRPISLHPARSRSC